MPAVSSRLKIKSRLYVNKACSIIVCSITDFGLSSGTTARCIGSAAPPSIKEPAAPIADITDFGPTTQQIRAPGIRQALVSPSRMTTGSLLTSSTNCAAETIRHKASDGEW
mmetsp:Transcript_44388/g.70933  ORF Transcript_44388/g.70933 Transcript_44388/m.70933 type:complete len:111 (-) Transcript_44388:128-460(-)